MTEEPTSPEDIAKDENGTRPPHADSEVSSSDGFSSWAAPIPPPPQTGGLSAPHRGWRKAWAIVGIAGGFVEVLFLTIPGWFALRSYRRWRKGEQDKPLFAWVWAWITAGFVALGVTGFALNAVIPNQLLQANFDRSPGPFTVATTPRFSADVIDGTYRIRIRAQRDSARSYANLVREAGAVAVSVDVVRVTPPAAEDIVGVVCAEANGDSYSFGAGTRGGYAILKISGAKATSLKEDESAPIPGSGKIERLRLTCQGNPFGPTKLWASINGTTVATLEDPHGFDSFTEIGLAFAGRPGAEVRFDNILARVPMPQDF